MRRERHWSTSSLRSTSHERRCVVMRDHRAGHDRLAGARWGDEDAAVVGREVRDGSGLLGVAAAPTNWTSMGFGLLRRSSTVELAAQPVEQPGDLFGQPAREVKPFEVLGVAGDEPWRVPGREPHALLLVELGVRDRPEVLQRGDDRRRQSRSFDRQSTGELSADDRRRGRPSLSGEVGEAERRTGIDWSKHRRELRDGVRTRGDRPWTGTPTGPACGSRVVGSRNIVLPCERSPPAAAERSGCRTRLWAGSPGRERTGRSSTGPSRRVRSWPGAATPPRQPVPSTRGRVSSKKTQTWPPSPERERSSAAGTPWAWHASR